MRICRAVLVIGLSFALTAAAQRISFGVIAGTNITNHFPAYESSYAGDPVNPPSLFQHLTGPRAFIFGGVVEARLEDRLSLEVNILHRPMNTTIVLTEYQRGGSVVTKNELTAVRAWEFPILLKYNLPVSWISGSLRPFLEAGPSFRTQEDASAAEPSRFGVSAGAGIAWQWRRLRIAPTLRYTRWQRDSIPRYPTKPDQLEFLTSVAYDADFRPRGRGERRFSLGVLAGYPLTQGFAPPILGPANPERPRCLMGLSTAVRVTNRVSVEVDGIYKPLRQGRDSNDPLRLSVLTWQVPVLAQYRLLSGAWRPFVEGGPSFRLSGNLNGYRPSPVGVTAGGGVERRLGAVVLKPRLRYTRWRRDDSFGRIWAPRTNQNAVELIVGISF